MKLLEHLIKELLDGSRIQAGKLEYVQEPVDLEALLSKVADTMQQQQMNGTHPIVVLGTTPCTLIGDKGQLEQVFINLISNAITYSPGATTIEVDHHVSSEAVTVSVRDHGISILQELHEKIFERFYHISSLSQRAVPGLGMGLYIVAEIVRHHGGTIQVESEVGNGSTFHVTLPSKDAVRYCQGNKWRRRRSEEAFLKRNGSIPKIEADVLKGGEASERRIHTQTTSE